MTFIRRHITGNAKVPSQNPIRTFKVILYKDTWTDKNMILYSEAVGNNDSSYEWESQHQQQNSLWPSQKPDVSSFQDRADPVMRVIVIISWQCAQWQWLYQTCLATAFAKSLLVSVLPVPAGPSGAPPRFSFNAPIRVLHRQFHSTTSVPSLSSVSLPLTRPQSRIFKK